MRDSARSFIGKSYKLNSRNTEQKVLNSSERKPPKKILKKKKGAIQ